MAPLAPQASGTLDPTAFPPATQVTQEAVRPSTPAPGPLVDDVYDPTRDPDNGWVPGRARVGDVTADEVRRARFRTVGDVGYAQADVDDFLDQVEATLRRWEQHATGLAGERPPVLDGWPFVREAPVQAAHGRQVAPSGLTLISRGLGYDVHEVDAFLEHAAVALELLGQGVAPEMTAEMVERALFRMTLDHGYDQREVDQLLDQVAVVLREGPRR